MRHRHRLQLAPLDAATGAAMATAGCNPHLELTVSYRKRMLSVLRHLGAKRAVAAAQACGSAGALPFVQPPSEGCPISLRNVCWGGPDCGGNDSGGVLKVGVGQSSRWLLWALRLQHTVTDGGEVALTRISSCRSACAVLCPAAAPPPLPPPLQVGDIYSTLRCPSPFLLHYSWAPAQSK